MDRYDVYCEFDIKKHKKTYTNYLEVLIREDGKIVYAVPSHTMKAERLVCAKLGLINQKQLSQVIPKTATLNYLTWLLTQANAVAVWNYYYETGENGLNNKQRAALRKLKMHGLYKGLIRS